MIDQLTQIRKTTGIKINNGTATKTINGNHDSTKNKVQLRSWGFRMAAQLNASLGGLRNVMDKVMSEYLAEVKDKEMPQHKDIKEELEDLKSKSIQKENDIKIEKEKQNLLKDEVEQHKKEIEAIRVDSEGDFLMSEFNWAKVILSTVFTVILGIALIFFYSSLINNAIFSDFGQRISGMNMDDLGIFNSIIDVNLLFNLNTATFISYLFSTLFIAIGMLLHFNLNNSKWKNRTIISGLIIFAFAAEVLFAYIIENNIYDLKMMTGMINQKPGFWSMILSKEVLTVLSLGFVSYLVWSLLFEVSLKEWRKRNPKKMAAIQIRELNRVINRRRQELGELKKEVLQLENDINLLEERVKALKLRLEHIFFDENEAVKRLTDFFNGWLQYINRDTQYSNMRSDYEAEFEQYKTELLKKHSA